MNFTSSRTVFVVFADLHLKPAGLLQSQWGNFLETKTAACKEQYSHKDSFILIHTADDPLRLVRDTETCAYVLLDPRVSRKQLALYAYHIPQSSEMLFTIQNLSQRGKLSVNTSALGYLERMDLPDKALIRFGEYEILIIRESGETKANFEVEFEVLAVPPSRETPMSMMNNFSAELSVRNPLESDEMHYPYWHVYCLC